MNKAASIAVKSLLGAGSVASAAGGGYFLWNKRVSETTKKEEDSNIPKNNRKEEPLEKEQKQVENPEDSKSDKVDPEEDSLKDQKVTEDPNSIEIKGRGDADESGSLKASIGEVDTGKPNNREEEDGRLKDQKAAEDPNSPEAKARKEKEMDRMEEKSVNWKDEQASLESEEKSWLPDRCNSDERGKSNSECDLSSGELKKIKFKELGDGKEAVTVAPRDSVNVKLKILQQGDMSKKYSFVNDSTKDIVISKGDKKVTLKAKGNTEFLREKEGLAMVKLKDYGIPEKCINSSALFAEVMPKYKGNKNIKQCVLTEGDLSKIKFHGFSDGVESNVTPLWAGDEKKGWGRAQNIILTIENGKYGFYNVFSDLLGHNQLAHRPIKITRGGVSVTLDGNMESEFTVEDDSLKKQEVTELGFPKRCEMGAEDESKSCELSDNDIRRLKLKETGVSPDLLPVDGNRKMKLRIEKVSDGDYPDNKKYILSALDSSVTIYNTAEVKDKVGKAGAYWTKSLSFNKDVEKTFKNEDNYLVLVN